MKHVGINSASNCQNPQQPSYKIAYSTNIFQHQPVNTFLLINLMLLCIWLREQGTGARGKSTRLPPKWPQVQVLVLLLALSLTQKPEEEPLSNCATSKLLLFIYLFYINGMQFSIKKKKRHHQTHFHTKAIGDKIVETLYSNRVTSENKRIHTPPLLPPFKVRVVCCFL